MAKADPIILDFEGFPDFTDLTNQYDGLTFVNATVISTSLDDAEFPPHSGVSAVFDNGGPITILFSQPVLSAGGYFTYSSQVSFTAFSGNTQVASVSSIFGNNEGLSGDPGSSPNEQLSAANPSGISKIVIQGDPAGTSLVLDDFYYQPGQFLTTPEPDAMLLALLGLGLVVVSYVSRRLRTQR